MIKKYTAKVEITVQVPSLYQGEKEVNKFCGDRLIQLQNVVNMLPGITFNLSEVGEVDDG